MLSKEKRQRAGIYRALSLLGIWDLQIKVAIGVDVDGGVGDVYYLEVVVNEEKACEFGRIA